MVTSHAYGLISSFSGAFLGREQDLGAFRDSGIKTRIENMLLSNNMNLNEFSWIGDKIFKDRLPCFHAMLRVYEDEEDEIYDQIDSIARTEMEHVIGKVTENWKYITYSNHLQIQLKPVARDITVAVILTNALSLLQGNQTHTVFRNDENPFLLEMPTLENYFGCVE